MYNIPQSLLDRVKRAMKMEEEDFKTYLSSLETTKILNCEKLIRKKCTIETKNYFYKLMLESNEYLFN